MKHNNKNILNKKTFFKMVIFCSFLINNYIIVCDNKTFIEEDNIPPSTINQLIVDMSTNSNVRAFLALIRYYESYYECANLFKDKDYGDNDKTHFLLFPTLDQYKILWGGKKFELLTFHPNKKLRLYHHWKKDYVTSSAAGRYQFIYPTWKWIKNLLKITGDADVEVFMKKYHESIALYKKNIKYLYDASIISFYAKAGSFEKELFGPFFQDLGALILIYIAGKKDNIDLIKMIKDGKIDNKKLYTTIAPTWEIFQTLIKRKDKLNDVIYVAKSLFTYMKQNFAKINKSNLTKNSQALKKKVKNNGIYN